MAKVKLKNYIDEKVKGVYVFSKGKYATISTSTKLAADALEKRLIELNNFREALKDQNKTFLTRTEFNILHGQVTEDIRILREHKATLEGKASSTSVIILYVIALISLGITIIKLFI